MHLKGVPSGNRKKVPFSSIFQVQQIAANWNSLSEDEKKDREYNHGCYPPPNDQSITHQLAKKYLKPWKPGSGSPLGKMTEEQKQKIVNEINSIIDSKKEVRGIDQSDFIIRQRTVKTSELERLAKFGLVNWPPT